MCMSTPKIPKQQSIQSAKMPETPPNGTAEQDARAKLGRRGTLLTSGAGAGSPTTAKKTLLGQ